MGNEAFCTIRSRPAVDHDAAAAAAAVAQGPDLGHGGTGAGSSGGRGWVESGGRRALGQAGMK